MGKLDNKVIFITGGGDGMGRATAVEAAKNGALVVIFELKKENAETTKQIVEENGGKIIAFIGDVTKEEQLQHAIEGTVKTFGSIDILVNNVGYDLEGYIHEVSSEEWDKVMNINVKSIYYASKYAIPHMIKKGKGNIINISSAAGVRARADTPIYRTAKAAVIMLTKSMALAYADKGIRVNSISPGLTETNMLSNMSQEYIDKIEQGIPIKRIGKPEDIALSIMYLASDESAYVTGTNLLVTGGLNV
jgi:3-oxoacyl-[acyl-carrier protein] reductase